MDNPIAANILGTAGAICWSIQLIPQIIKNYRRHSTTGLHHTMYLLWALAGIPLGVYNLAQPDFNIALRIQPHILIFLSLVTWQQCLYYSARQPLPKVLLAATALGVLIGGVEAGFYFALQRAHAGGLEWPFVLMAVLAAILLALGVVRYYWEIYKARSVDGISFLFVAIDAGGDLVSVLSLLFQARVDVLGVVVYSVELGLWMGIGLLGVYFRLRPWVVQRIGKRVEVGDGDG